MMDLIRRHFTGNDLATLYKFLTAGMCGGIKLLLVTSDASRQLLDLKAAFLRMR